jgi:competence protein ComEC
LSSCILVLLVLIGTKWNRAPVHLVVFQKSKQTMLAIKQEQSSVFLLPDSISKTMHAIISDYKTGSYSRNSSEKEIPHIFKYKDTTVLILDKLGIFPKGLKSPIVLLTQSTQVHLDRFIDSVQPIRIIADGSNYKSSIVRWKETCRQKKIPFHSTYEKGAYVWE